jgi:ABC-type dipeptide/oligopeptide/nickel transport system permease subunit
MIVITVLGFTLAGEGLDEIFRMSTTRKREVI